MNDETTKDVPTLQRLALRLSGRTHAWLYRTTKGKLGGQWRGGAALRKPAPVLLLRHIGRKSGKTFVSPVLYLREGSDLVIVASQGGAPTDPQWFRNLVATPECEVQVGSQLLKTRARTAVGEERARIWPKLVVASTKVVYESDLISGTGVS